METVLSPTWEFSYRLTQEEFYRFNEMSVADYYQKTCRRNRIMGLLEIIVGLLLGVMSVAGWDSRMPLYLLLAAAVIAVGIYMLFFYKKYFTGNLRKSVEKEYGSNPYFQEEIRLQFAADGFTEVTAEGEKAVGYDAVASVCQYEELVVLSMEKGSSVILPVRLFPQSDPGGFLNFVKDKIEAAAYGPAEESPEEDGAEKPASEERDAGKNAPEKGHSEENAPAP